MSPKQSKAAVLQGTLDLMVLQAFDLGLQFLLCLCQLILESRSSLTLLG